MRSSFLLKRNYLRPLHRSLHGQTSQNANSTQTLIPANPNPNPSSEEDATMNEFLSRFVHSIRPILTSSYPSLPRETLDSMLILICRRIVSDEAADIELSEDLWTAINEVSRSVHDAMRRDRVRSELRKYLHSDDVKEMCRFAGDVGVRGDMMRELRFKWAREKMEEVEFYRGLEKMRENASEERAANVEALPQRKGKVDYRIYGLDLSEEKWKEVAERAEEAERKVLVEEAKPVVGRVKRIEEKVYGLNLEEDDLVAGLKEWGEALGARRVDWVALLERIKEKKPDMYMKVAELLLDEESFESNIHDYSRLIDAYSKSDHIADAERILKKMTEKEITPDILTSLILLHMYSKAGDLGRTEEAFETLRTQGFQPDLKVYTSMINAYVKADLPKKGEDLSREMENRHIKPTEETYMALLRSYVKKGLTDGAQRMVTTMQLAGMKLTLESSTLLVDAYGQAGDPDHARGHFDQMLQSGIKPDDRCVASMISAYVKKNLLDKGLDLLLTLEKDGFTPGILTKSVIVNWLGKLQLVEEAERVMKEILNLGDAPIDVHVSLCDMYARVGNKVKAREEMKILNAKKDILKAEHFERIVNGFLDGRNVQEAKKIFQMMKELGHTPSEPLKVAISAAELIPPPRTAGRRW